MASSLSRHWFLALPLLLASSGCSLLYDLNTTQCEVSKDCAALGPQFANSVCVNQVCVALSASSGAGGGSAGGNNRAGAGGSAGGDMVGDAGSGDSAGAGAISGMAGNGGSAPQPECTTNEQCISAHVDQPYLCKDGSCLALTSTDCPVLLPTGTTLDLLRTANPIVVGGYANMSNPQDPHDSLAVINWDLAFNEFNTATLGGLPNKAGGDPRPVLALICQSGAADITPSLTFLTEQVAVPAILSTLSTDKLFSAFNFTQAPEYSAAGGQPVLFLSTGSADLRLANLSDDGLVWHMLGDPRLLAATTVGLLNKMVQKVNAARMNAGEDTVAVPLRVTLVYSDDATMTDLFSVLTTPDAAHPETLLTFNGKSAISQIASGDFREVKIQSAKKYTTPDVSNAITDLENFPPHIIVALATSEFPKTVIPSIENYWIANQRPGKLARPFYLASHFLYNTPELQTVAGQFSNTMPIKLSDRLVGVNYAEAQDAHSKQLYDSYQGRLQSSYQGALQLAGTENYYDGAYSVLYSLAAAYAARAAPTGNDVRNGLQGRVFSSNGAAQSVDIGPAALGGTVGKMSSLTYQMALWGTMGAPDFDRTSGTRLSATSAWCMQQVAQTWTYEADGLIYDPTTRGFTSPAAGTPACLAGY
jgi:hypothetical protein